MSIPLDAVKQLRTDPTAQERLQSQFGGSKEVDKDGSVYSSIGNRPIPPPKALRKIHAHRQEEREQREEEEEAAEFEKAHGMGVAEDRTALHFEAGTGTDAVRRKRELAQQDLEARLHQTAYSYEIGGCGIDDCNGTYEYSTASSHGAPVYQSGDGWTLHRGRPPVETTIGSGEEVTEFGWIISKGGKPMYAVKTEDLFAPERGWQCFYGPPPTPSQVSHLSWQDHFSTVCGKLKDAGNAALSQGKEELAQESYSKALELLDGYEEVVSSSEKLERLVVTLLANRAEVRLRLQLWAEAKEDAQEVLQRDPTHVKAAVRLGKACRALCCWQDAVGPLQKLLDELAPQGHAEVRELLDEAELLASCQSGRSRLSGLFQEARIFCQELERGRLRSAGPGAELQHAAQQLVASLCDLDSAGSSDPALQRELRLLLQGLSILDSSLAAVADECLAPDWGLDLLASCVGPQLRDDSLRRVLATLPGVVPQLAASPQRTLELIRRLLKHRSREQLKVADTIIEAKGLLVACLRSWLERLDLRYTDEGDEQVVEVVHQLSAQVSRLDNMEALALALFVECFIGQKHETGVTGGFSLFLGGQARQVTLDLLRRWGGDSRVLQSLSPELVGRIWSSTAAKLRREAGVETEKTLQTGQRRTLKLEWFKLKDLSTLSRHSATFFPEELVAAVLAFAKAHLKATCDRGCERQVSSGIAARHPAEEWMDEVLDRPFAWGVLLPLAMAPPSLACPALGLLEELIHRHPHTEKLANRLAGLHLFIPLLGLPWPQAQPATAHLGETIASGPLGRQSACSVLRCTIDTEIGLRVARDVTSACMKGVLDLLQAVLPDHDHPQSLLDITEVLGILAGNLSCWDKVPDEVIGALLQELMRSSHKPTRAQLARVLRSAHADPHTRPVLQHCMEDAQLGLGEEQRTAVMAEIFDVQTLAGKARAERIMEATAQEEQKPVEPADAKERRRAQALAEAVYERYLKAKQQPRVLVMGRLAKALGNCLGRQQGSCRVVLGDTSLERLGDSELGSNVEKVLLPVPQGVDEEPVLSSQEKFDMVLTGEPIGYFDAGEYAERLRPFIKRREKEDDKESDQVQWICLEMLDRLEDARDDMYSAGYYKADHDSGFEALRKAAQKLELGVALFALPSYERENRKRTEDRKAVERKIRREKEEEAQAKQDEENEQRRNVLCETLFDPLLSPVEVSSLPVLYEIGAEQEEADLVLFWLHGNGEVPESSESLFADLLQQCEAAVRVVGVTFPEGRSDWYRWSDEVAVNHGTEFYEMSEGPYDEAIEKAKKEPAKNISFGKPSFEEMQCVEELEPCCKQLLNLAEEIVAGGLKSSARLAFGGFAQGGSVAVYAALSNTAVEEVQKRLCGVMPCCSGVPVMHFLAPRMQKTCLQAQEQLVHQQPIRVRMVYGTGDSEVKENYVETCRDLYRRFDYPVTLSRFEALPEDRFPEGVRREQLQRALRAWTKTS